LTTDKTKRSDRLMKPSEVAVLFGVNAKTVTRWAQLGKLSAVRTRGGHRRFHEEEVLKLLSEM